MEAIKFTNLTGQRIKLLIKEYNDAHPDSKINQKILVKNVLYTNETSFSEKIRGKRTFPPEEIEKIANFFSVSPKWLLGEVNYRSRLEAWEAIKKEKTEHFLSFCNILEELCTLKGVIFAINKECATDIDCFCTLTDGERQVKMSLLEFYDFGDRLLDHFTVDLRYLFADKAEIIEGE